MGIVNLDQDYKSLDISTPKDRSEAIRYIHRVDYLLNKYNYSINKKDIFEYFYIKNIYWKKIC